MSMREQIAAIAGPMSWTDNRKSWLSRVPERVEHLTGTRLSLRLIKAAWHNEITENHWAALELRKAVGVIEFERELAKAKQRHQTLVERLDILASDFHQPTIAKIIDAIRKLRGEDR